MPRETAQIPPGISDEDYQERILPHVSRTFALTIPQLPPALSSAVTSAYLLCRIADTIEDEPALSTTQTLAYLERFKAVVHGHEDAAPLAAELGRLLTDHTLPEERDLVANMARPIRLVARLDEPQRRAIRRCVDLMCYGMHHFQRTASLRGLPSSADLDAYCYCVAGVVGEMLTELFCGHSALAARRHSALKELAVSFAQGLQMTNILKDVWEDRGRGACWLPQEVFGRHGIDLARLSPETADARFAAAMREMLATAHAHLRNALAFALLIPARETGIRRFCLWAIGLAVLTLRRIADNPAYTAGAQVKVSRSTVRATCLMTGLAVRSDWMLERLFDLAARGLPLASPVDVRRSGRIDAFVARLERTVAEAGCLPAAAQLDGLTAVGANAPPV